MKRLWQICLPLSCGVFTATLWMALAGAPEPLPEQHEAVETARLLESIQRRVQSTIPERQPEAAGELAPAARQPELHSPVDVAEPIAQFDETGEQRTATPSNSDPVISVPTLTAGPDDSESRVSIVQWSSPEALKSRQATAIRPQLNPQDFQNAAAHLHYGKILARKGATSSARSEFLNALTVIAQSNDQQTGSKAHWLELQRAIRTLDEADDFYAGGTGSDLDTDIASISEGHLCRVLTAAEAAQHSQADALAAYHCSARQDLEHACGSPNPLASEILFALGRLHGLLGQADPAQQPREYSKSTTFHQAALRADPNNFAAANELGVLMARKGEWALARELLIRSVTLSPRAETWSNLAKLHQHLGETQLAALASNESQLLSSSREPAATPLIRLVPSAEFEAVPDTQDADPPNQTAKLPDSASSNQLR